MSPPKHLICNSEKFPCTGMKDYGDYVEYSIDALAKRIDLGQDNGFEILTDTQMTKYRKEEKLVTDHE